MNNIRVSAASLARIVIDGKFLVGLNKASLRFGRRVYTPFGGALEFFESARPFLSGLGATFEKKNDLKIAIPEDKLSEFKKWFYSRTHREISPYRELMEELVLEEKIFHGLPLDVVGLKYLKTDTEIADSSRPESLGRTTRRFFEIYDVNFKPEYEQILRNALHQQNTNLALITSSEIKAGVSNSGIEVATSCLPIV